MSSKSPATGRGKGGGAGKGVDTGGKPTSSVQRVKGPLALSDKSPLFRDCSNDPPYNVKLLILGKRQVEKGIARFKPDKGDTNNYDEPLILTEESTATVEQVISECETKYGQVSPRNKYVPPGAQVGYTMILPKAKELPAWWRGMEHDPATQVGMDDKYAYERMSQYLWINSRRQMVSVPRNGNCLSAALRKFFEIKNQKFPRDSFYPNRYMKRYLTSLLVKWRKQVLDRFRLFLKSEYCGGTDAGPFTYRQYVSYMNENYSHGDICCLFALAMETHIKIMIVLHPTLVLIPVTHFYSLDDADIVLVLANDHWTPAVQFQTVAHKKGEDRQVVPRGHGLKFLVFQEGDGKPVVHQSAHDEDTETDNGWSTEEEEMHCGEAYRHKRTRVKKKKKASATPPPPPPPPGGQPQPHSSHQNPPDAGGADGGAGGGAAGDGGDGGGAGDQGGNQGGGDADKVSVKRDTVKSLLSATNRLSKGLKRMHDESGIAMPPKKQGKFTIKPVQKGQKECEVCKRTFYDEKALKKHLPTHTEKKTYECADCNATFNHKASLARHKRQKGDKSGTGACQTWECDYEIPNPPDEEDPEADTGTTTCGKILKTSQALNRHRTKHEREHNPDYQPPAKVHPCMYDCGTKYASARSVRYDHEPYCEKNPNRKKKVWCPLEKCKYEKVEGGFKGWKKRRDLNRHLKARHPTYTLVSETEDEDDNGQ